MRKRPFRYGLLVLLAWLGATAPRRAAAFPPLPLTLWDLTEQAQVVAVATIVAVEEDKDALARWNGMATLEIKDELKGTTKAKRIEVAYSTNTTCAAPPVLQRGRVALVFLAKGAQAPWQLANGSQGLIYPDALGLPTFKRLVVDAAAIQANYDRPDASAAYARWRITAAEQPGTRWHGVFAIFSDVDPNYGVWDRFIGKRRRRLPPPSPSEADLDRLARILAQQTQADRTTEMLRKLLAHRQPAPEDLQAPPDAAAASP